MIFSKTDLDSREVALHYDELDLFYREIWGDHVHHGLWLTGSESREKAILQLVALVARQAGVQCGTRVCDVGCGYGATSRFLVENHSAAVTALTVSPAQYHYASSLNPASTNPRYLLRDWLHNDLPTGSFDAVISIESSEHMRDKLRFFSEAHRVLGPNGRFVVCAWLSREAPSLIENHFLLEPICREGRMPSMGTEQDYMRFLANSGFEFECFRDLTKAVKKTWPLCAGRFLGSLCQRPAYAKFLFNRHRRNRIFALTMLRIWLAYSAGSMRYGIFTARKPG